MKNGYNNWGASYSHIKWFEQFLAGHTNVKNIERHHDIIFEIDRKKQNDHLRILCCNEYTMSYTLVLRGCEEFGPLNIFYIGGGWCGYTRLAKEYCIENQIGLFVTDEIRGALWKDEYWTCYSRTDEKGNPLYYFRAA